MQRAVWVSGLSGYGGQLGKCSRLAVGVSNGAGEGLSVGGQPGRAAHVSCPGGAGGQRASAWARATGSVMARATSSARSRSPAWAAAAASVAKARA